MKKIIIGLILIGSAIALAQYSTSIYHEQGGAKMVVATGGELEMQSGSTFDLQTPIYMTPTDTVPTATEGAVYFDNSENALKYYNASNWIALTTGTGDNTLDDAYDQGGAGAGRTITADTGAVTITNTDTDGAFVLALTPTPSGAAALGGMSIAVGANSTQDAIQIGNSGSGDDIQGTSSTWKVTKAGVGTFTDVQSATGTFSGVITASGGVTMNTLTLESAETITNSVDSEITLTQDGGENLTFDMDSGTNAVGLKSSTGVVELAMGAVDDLTGVGTIVFDAAAVSITQTADAAAEDFTVSMAGGVDASLVLSSAGTGGDALQMVTSAGGMDITVAGAGDGEDLDILSNRSLTVTSSEATNDAIKLNASNAAGGIDIDTGGKIAVDLSGAGSDFDVDSAAGSVYLDGGEADVKAIWLAATNAAGGITMDYGTANMIITGTGVSADFTLDADLVSIDGTGTSNVTVTANAGAEDFTIAQAGAVDASLILTSAGTGADALQLSATNAAGGMTVGFGTGNMVVTGTGVSADFTLDADLISIDGTGTSNISFANGAGEDVTIATTGAADHSLIIAASGTAEDAMQITASAGGINMSSSTDPIDITVAADGAADDLTLNVTGAQNASIVLTSAGTGADAISLQMDGTGGGLSVDTDDGAISIVADGATNGDITLDAEDVVSITAGDAAGILASTNAKTFKYKVIPISYISATECRVGGGGYGNLCVGLAAGADEIGSTEGYATVGDAADFLRFTIEMPDDWVDTGTATDLVLQFDIAEQAAEECNIDIRIFEYGNTTPIMTDTLLIANGQGRQWESLITAATGIGADADIDRDDVLLIEVTATADTDDFDIYGCRLKYRVGLQATQ